ncbi:MAG TPA: CPBP family intramembrane metalloprotease [Firmicutes bacterium]|nr:CPBP family intramembrane metalloprotease [Bacillota bacterium]
MGKIRWFRQKRNDPPGRSTADMPIGERLNQYTPETLRADSRYAAFGMIVSLLMGYVCTYAVLLVALPVFALFSGTESVGFLGMESAFSSPTFIVVVNALAMVCSTIFSNLIPFSLCRRAAGLREKLCNGLGMPVLYLLGLFPVVLGVNMWGGFFSSWVSDLMQRMHLVPTEPDFSLPDVPAASILMTLSIVVLAPIFEEYVFRGVLLRIFQRYGDGFAILLSGFLFGMAHANLPQFCSAFPIGLVLGYIAVRSHSILPTILLHLGNNLFVTLTTELAFNSVVAGIGSIFNGIISLIPGLGGLLFIGYKLFLMLEDESGYYCGKRAKILLRSWPVWLMIGLYVLQSLRFLVWQG